MADTASKPAAAATTTNNATNKPTKPDEEKYQEELAKAQKELKASQDKLNAVKAKLDLVQNKDRDSPQNQKQSALRAEQAEIRKKHAGHKESRQKTQDQVKRLDEKLKSLITEQKNAKAKVPFKSVEDIDREIERLQKQVDSGTMKLVDEKKALSDISGFHRARKGFAGFAAQEKQIADVKAQISDLKKGSDNPEVKALNDRYDSIQAQLNDMRKDTDAAFKNLNSLRDERTKAQKDQQDKWSRVKEIQDTFHQSRRAWQDYDRQQRNARREKIIAEKQAYESGKRREVAQRKLEEASAPAYHEEILTAEGLIRHFDPSAVDAKATTTTGGKFAASAQRTVEDTAFQGTRVVSKKDNEEDFFAGTGGKKKKGKNNKAAAASGDAAAPAKFNLSYDVIESLARLSVDPPVSASHVPIVITALKEKIAFWKKDQERKTAENVAKAKKEIEKLEQEASPSVPVNADSGAKDKANKPAEKALGANGKPAAEAVLENEKDAEKDVAAELEKAKIEDDA